MHLPIHSYWKSVVLCVLLSCFTATAQVTTADILGTVTDSSGAVVAGAKVNVVSLGTKVTRTVETSGSGDYVFNLLQPGRYSVHIEALRFKAFDVSEVSAGAGDRVRVDAKMQVGQTSESVTVSAEVVPALQTDSSTVQDVVTEKSVQDLPLNGRNLTSLVQITAGVNAGPPNAISSGNRPDDRRPTSAFSANGQSDLLNNSLIDGLDNNEREQGFNGFRPSIDGIAEVRVLTNDYPAEVGRAAGAIVNVITKAGSNELHGSLYEYFRNDIFDARDFFAIVGKKPEFRQNQFGGSLGGSIVKNKIFFFGDIEENRIVQGITYTSTVPTLHEEQNPGDFSDLCPGGPGTACAGGPILMNLSPVALNYFKLYPAPNLAGMANNFESSPAKTQYSTTFDLRLDHHINDNNSLFVRYGYNPVSTFIPGRLPAVSIFGKTVQPGGSVGDHAGPSKTTGQGLQLNYVHVFRPNLLLELKAGYTRINIQTFPLNYGTNLASQFGIVNGNLGADSSALPIMFFFGDYASVGDGFFVPILDTNNIFQYNGTVTYTRGAHNIKFGGALIRRQLNYFQDGYSPQGGFVFLPVPYVDPKTGDVTFNSMVNLLNGNPLFAERGNLLTHPGYRTWEPSAYLQDDWRAKNWLTLNLGVRYEIFTPFTEAHNQQSNFNIKTLSVVQASSSNPTMGVNTEYHDFSPRIGFAATLKHDLVVRGGFGISYYPTDISTGAIQNANPPFSFGCFPCLTTSFPTLPLPTSSTTNPAGAVTVKPSNFGPAYIEQLNFFVQKQMGANVLSVGYVGELGRRLWYQSDLDRPAPPGPGNPTPALIYATQLPLVSEIDYNYNGATSNYHALQLNLARRYSKGLTLNANYTWAHGLTTTTNGGGGSTNPNTPALITSNLKYDYGNTDIDVRHRVAVSANYELPFGKALTGASGQIVKGWQVNAIAFWQTGIPFTVTNGSPQINVPGVLVDRPDVVPGQSLSISNPSIHQWFNLAAFTPQVFGTAGNESRNPLYGPHQRRVDLSLFKNFRLTDKWHLQFRAECFNVSNTPNFSLPNASVSEWNGPVQPGASPTNAGGFGTISSTAQNEMPRQFQFALKLLF